jgi:DNA-binding NarL/FixJ family response regulator
VLIVDDHAEFRKGLTALLSTSAEVELVGVAADGQAALEVCGRLQPDVVLMDLHMPSLNGVEATRAITSMSPHIRVLVLTMFDNDDSLLAALRAGAHGYLLKGAGRDDVLRAIRNVASGDLVVGAASANRLLRALTQSAPVDDPFPELSRREGEILDLIATGANNTQISERLFLSPKTVRNHVTNIYAKLGVSDRPQAIVLARERRARREKPTW